MTSDIFTKNCARSDFEKHAVQFVGVDQYMDPSTHKGRVSEVNSCEFLGWSHLKGNPLAYNFGCTIYLRRVASGALQQMTTKRHPNLCCKEVSHRKATEREQ
eukprot:6655313-Ditylum_brightwellii.AAC.1